MEKRVLIAVFLSFLVLFLYQSFLVPIPEAPVEREVPLVREEVLEPLRPAPEAVPPAPPDPLPVEAAVEPIVGGTAPQNVTVESGWVTAVFDTRGGEIRSWRLAHFMDQDGEPLDLVPAGLPPDQPRPFSLSVEDPELTRRLSQAIFQPSTQHLQVDRQSEVLVFEYRDAAGLSARKEFRFDPEISPYIIGFSVSVEYEGRALNPTVQWGPGPLGDALGTASGWYAQPPQAIFFRDGDLTRLPAGRVREQPAHEGRFAFVGVDDHYFLATALPGAQTARVEYLPLSVPVPGTTETQEMIAFQVRFAEPPANLPFFFGPKDFDVLAAVHQDLVRAINFGWFSFLVVPLLRSLKWVYGYVGNYGWAIIILTILINAAMFPLRHKSVVSMRKMQELQPEVKAIQERYGKLKATDPARQKMNVELMNLYRERGVNPASGCIPMLLTMPVLFAFYSLLSVAIEIRGAPFVLWIADLSVHDPLYVTPVLMGLSMVYQMRITPSTADPMQQKIMMVMPIMFTFFFLWAPSGLVLYWLVSNVWAIGQQQITNKIIGPPAVRVVRPPAERRVKKAGAGKTPQAAKGQA